ncbi:MAG: glyoxalase, partial [Chloroflexota bacterium]
NDLWYWEITMVTNDIESMFSELIAPLDQLVSSGIVTLPDQNPLGYQRAFIFRDRDGHAIKVISV